jgi:hypothetical protein
MPSISRTHPAIISLDVKTNSIFGLPYAVAAQFHDSFYNEVGEKQIVTHSFQNILLNTVGDGDVYTKEKMNEFKERNQFASHEIIAAYEQMLYNFRDWFMEMVELSGYNYRLVVHGGAVCESMLFRQVEMLKLIDSFDVPYPFIDTASMLYQKDPTCNYVDIIAIANKIRAEKKDLDGQPEILIGGPIDTCAATMITFNYLTGNE